MSRESNSSVWLVGSQSELYNSNLLQRSSLLEDGETKVRMPDPDSLSNTEPPIHWHLGTRLRWNLLQGQNMIDFSQRSRLPIPLPYLSGTLYLCGFSYNEALDAARSWTLVFQVKLDEAADTAHIIHAQRDSTARAL